MFFCLFVGVGGEAYINPRANKHPNHQTDESYSKHFSKRNTAYIWLFNLIKADSALLFIDLF